MTVADRFNVVYYDVREANFDLRGGSVNPAFDMGLLNAAGGQVGGARPVLVLLPDELQVLAGILARGEAAFEAANPGITKWVEP